MKYSFLTICAILFAFHAKSQQIDPNFSSVSFEISNFGIKTVDGSVSNMNGTVDFDAQSLDLCRFDVCIDATTIDTGNTDRDEHLAKSDFFNSVEHPTICFYSENVTKLSAGYAVTGTLSIKGIEKIATINFTHENDLFKGNLEVDRADFQLGPGGGFMIGKTAQINIVAKVMQ